jgi:hypothetical protein
VKRGPKDNANNQWNKISILWKDKQDWQILSQTNQQNLEEQN